MRKYELTEETKIVNGDVALHRIQAVRDFGDVKTGDIGGWIEREDNLSHDGMCWVYDEACVHGNALVFDDAQVSDFAVVYGRAGVGGCAKVYGNAMVYGNANVFVNAEVYDFAKIYGCAKVLNYAKVYGDSEVYDESWVYGKAKVSANAKVRGYADIRGDAEVKSEDDYSVYQNTWSSHRWFTYTRSNRMWSVGCFHGTGEELIAKAYKDSEISGRCYEAVVRAQEAIDTALDENEKTQGDAE